MKMYPRQTILSLLLLTSILVLLGVSTPIQRISGQDNEYTPEDFLLALNQELRDSGYLPLSRNQALDETAQFVINQTGCVGTWAGFLPTEAYLRGYGTYSSTDSISHTTNGDVFPMAQSITNGRMVDDIAADVVEAIREQIAAHGYREIGIVIQNCPPNQIFIFVVLGAQPDVLPIIVNNGETVIQAQGTSATVALSIHDEDGRPRYGGSSEFLGGQEMQITVTNANQGITMQETLPYQDRMMLDLACGMNTIQIVLSDSAGHTMTSRTMVEVQGCNSPMQPTDTLTPLPESPSRQPNRPPVIDLIGDKEVVVGQTINFSVPISDPNGDPLEVSLSFAQGSENLASIEYEYAAGILQISTIGQEAGSAIIVITAEDGNTEIVQQSFNLSIVDIIDTPPTNVPPTIAPIPSQTVIAGHQIVIPLDIQDPDGDTVTVQAFADDPAIATSVGETSRTGLTVQGHMEGQTTFRVTVNDGQGHVIEASFIVEVQHPTPSPTLPPTLTPTPTFTPMVLPTATDIPPPLPTATLAPTNLGDSIDCSNTNLNDWNASVAMNLVWNQDALTISFDTEADCIWLFGLTFEWGDGQQYVLTQDPDYSQLYDLGSLNSPVSFAAFPSDRCLQIQAQNRGDDFVVVMGRCNSADNTFVTDYRFASNEFFWATRNSTFRVIQENNTSNQPCQTEAGSCHFQWNNTTPFHQNAPVWVNFDYMNPDIMVISFVTAMEEINLRDFEIGWVDNVRRFALREPTWRDRNEQQVTLPMDRFPANGCLLLTAAVYDGPIFIPDYCTGDIFVGRYFTRDRRFWIDPQAANTGFNISNNRGNTYPFNCPQNPRTCQIQWQPLPGQH